MKKFLTCSQRVITYSYLYRKNNISKELLTYGNSLKIIEEHNKLSDYNTNILYYNIALCFIKLKEIDVAKNFIDKII
jgi:hypothetical protein